MFFKKKKEIENLKREIDGLIAVNEKLTNENEKLKEEMNDDYVDPDFCAVCENGITSRSSSGYLYCVKCTLDCNCENFERKLP